MPKNTLYNFIKGYIYKGKKLRFEGRCNLVLDSTNKAESYYRFDLDVTSPVSLASDKLTLSLTSHHISVYEEQEKKNPVLSQYHYTAYFKGNDDNSYQLHVYLDDKDEVQTTLFSIENKTGEYKKISFEKCSEQFTSLAFTYTQPILALLRVKQENTIEALKIKIAELDSLASKYSENLPETFAAHQETLKNLMDETKKLSALIVKNSHYEASYKFVARLKEAFIGTHAAAKKTTAEKYAPEQIHPPSDVIPIASRNNKTNPLKKGTKTKEKPAVNSAFFASQVDELRTALASIKKEDLKSIATEIEAISQKYNDLSLKISNKLAPHCLSQFHHLTNEINQKKQIILFQLIKHEKYDLAAQITAAHHLLDANHLKDALATKNHNLLDFLLTYGDYSINTQALTINGSSHSSAVHYCLNTYSKKNNTAECLAVLIKHGASLFVNNNQGLPIAHVLLTLPTTHPLSAALTANSEITIHNRAFYKRLIASLEQWLFIHKIEESEKKRRVLEAIKIYKLEAGKIEYSSALGSSSYILRNITSELRAKVDPELYKRLMSEPEYLALSEDINKICKKYFAALTPRQKRMELIRVKQATKEYVTSARQHVYNPKTYSMNLKAVIDHLKLVQEKLKLLCEMVDLGKSLKGARHKEKKDICKKINELDNQIQKVTKQIDMGLHFNVQSSLFKLFQVLKTFEKHLDSGTCALDSLLKIDEMSENALETIYNLGLDKDYKSIKDTESTENKEPKEVKESTDEEVSRPLRLN